MHSNKLCTERLVEAEIAWAGQIKLIFATGYRAHFEIRNTEWRFKLNEEGYISRYEVLGPPLYSDTLFSLIAHKAEETMKAIRKGYVREGGPSAKKDKTDTRQMTLPLR